MEFEQDRIIMTKEFVGKAIVSGAIGAAIILSFIFMDGSKKVIAPVSAESGRIEWLDQKSFQNGHTLIIGCDKEKRATIYIWSNGGAGILPNSCNFTK